MTESQGYLKGPPAYEPDNETLATQQLKERVIKFVEYYEENPLRLGNGEARRFHSDAKRLLIKLHLYANQ